MWVFWLGIGSTSNEGENLCHLVERPSRPCDVKESDALLCLINDGVLGLLEEGIKSFIPSKFDAWVYNGTKGAHLAGHGKGISFLIHQAKPCPGAGYVCRGGEVPDCVDELGTRADVCGCDSQSCEVHCILRKL